MLGMQASRAVNEDWDENWKAKVALSPPQVSNPEPSSVVLNHCPNSLSKVSVPGPNSIPAINPESNTDRSPAFIPGMSIGIPSIEFTPGGGCEAGPEVCGADPLTVPPGGGCCNPGVWVLTPGVGGAVAFLGDAGPCCTCGCPLGLLSFTASLSPFIPGDGVGPMPTALGFVGCPSRVRGVALNPGGGPAGAAGGPEDPGGAPRRKRVLNAKNIFNMQE